MPHGSNQVATRHVGNNKECLAKPKVVTEPSRQASMMKQIVPCVWDLIRTPEFLRPCGTVRYGTAQYSTVHSSRSRLAVWERSMEAALFAVLRPTLSLTVKGAFMQSVGCESRAGHPPQASIPRHKLANT